MKLNTSLKIVVLVLVVIAIGLAYLLGAQHAEQSMTLKHATPTQLAEAMKGDHFYSDYRENTLLINGSISSVTKSGNDQIVEFNVASTYAAKCDLANSAASLHQGDSITVLAEGGAAERQPSAVLLKNCTIL